MKRPVETASTRFFLREATSASHERLDRAASRLDLSRKDDYARFIGWHDAVLPAIEAHLEDHGISGLLPDWPQRRRRTALAHDKRVLGLGPSKPRAPTNLPHTPAALWGIVYVLEGSRLGNEVLRRRVAPDLAPIATHYLAHGAGEKLWPGFVNRLDAEILSPSDREAAAQGALASFAAFEHALAPVTEKQKATSAHE